jgi:hypothetical protein
LTLAILGSILLAASTLAGAQDNNWVTQVGNSGGNVSVVLSGAVRYQVTAYVQHGGATFSYTPVTGGQVNTAFGVTVGTLHIKVVALNTSGSPVDPKTAICNNGTSRHFTISQPGAGNPCANYTEAVVTVTVNP